MIRLAFIGLHLHIGPRAGEDELCSWLQAGGHVCLPRRPLTSALVALGGPVVSATNASGQREANAPHSTGFLKTNDLIWRQSESQGQNGSESSNMSQRRRNNSARWAIVFPCEFYWERQLTLLVATCLRIRAQAPPRERRKREGKERPSSAGAGGRSHLERGWRSSQSVAAAVCAR